MLAEVESLQDVPGYKGILSDLGGPTANMYKMTCSDPETEKMPQTFLRPPDHLQTAGHGPSAHQGIDAGRAEVTGVKKVMVASGVRMDLANLDQEYINELAAYHVGGHLKVAPEHVDSDTLRLMKKPGVDVYLEFEKKFQQASRKANKEQYLVPYFVSSHPGCDTKNAVDLASFLKARNLRPRQVQDFIPTPGTPATCMWWTGIDPHTMKKVWVETKMRSKRRQRALLQYWKPENQTLIREALRESGRTDLIGHGKRALAPPGGKQRSGNKKPVPFRGRRR